MKPRRIVPLKTGHRFFRLTIKSSMIVKKYGLMYLCICDCGSQKTIRHHALVGLFTRSCGCLSSQLTSERNTKHGLYGSPEHLTWRSMLQRCRDKNSPQYARYGGRGITVCDEWLIFVNFLNDMGERPSRSHSIDRIDNSLGYFKDNCRWATKKQQARNRRSSNLFTINGKTKTVAEWSEISGLKYGTVISRIRRGDNSSDVLRKVGS